MSYSYELSEDHGIRDETTTLEDIREGHMNPNVLSNHIASCYMHSQNEEILTDMHGLEVFYFLDCEKTLQAISSMLKVNHWLYS